MSRPQAWMVDGVDRAAFALMCAMTNWAQPNPTEQEGREETAREAAAITEAQNELNRLNDCQEALDE